MRVLALLLLSVGSAQVVPRCAVLSTNAIPNAYTGEGGGTVTGSAALPLPFGSTQTTGNYTVTPNVIFLWDPPLLLDFCVRSSRAFVTASGTLPFVQGVAIGSAGFALGRICLMLGVTIDDVTNRRTAYFNISSNLIGLDNCYLQAGSPLTGAGLGGVFPALFPSQVRLNNYQFTDTNAIKSCPLPRANDMPAELLGSAATQGSIVPWALFNGIPPALVSGQTALATDGVYQEFLSTSIVMNYCLYSVTRLTVTAPQGTATPPGAPAPSSARGATFGWWSVRFGDRALYPTQSICALFARVPSATIPGADDLVYVMGQPGFPVCPTAWDGSAGSNNGTYVGFYPTAWGPAGSANGAPPRRLALAGGLLQLAVAFAASFLAFDALAPRGET